MNELGKLIIRNKFELKESGTGQTVRMYNKIYFQHTKIQENFNE